MKDECIKIANDLKEIMNDSNEIKIFDRSTCVVVGKISYNGHMAYFNFNNIDSPLNMIIKSENRISVEYSNTPKFEIEKIEIKKCKDIINELKNEKDKSSIIEIIKYIEKENYELIKPILSTNKKVLYLTFIKGGQEIKISLDAIFN